MTLHKCIFPILMITTGFTFAAESVFPLLLLVKQGAEQQKEAGVIRTVVFDLDETLCWRESVTAKPYMSEHHPEYLIVDYVTPEQKDVPHLFVPYVGELFLNILHWGWRIAIFSAGDEVRNTPVMTDFLCSALKPYTLSVQNDVAWLFDEKYIRVFSKHHLDGPFDRCKAGEFFGRMKKDLSKIVDDCQNSILVDDDCSYLYMKDFPFVSMRAYRYPQCSLVDFVKDYDLKDIKYHPMNNAAYILGILITCKKLIDVDQSISLKNALGKVISVTRNSTKFKNRLNLYDQPLKDLLEKYILIADQDLKRTQEWIDKGNALIDEMHGNRIE